MGRSHENPYWAPDAIFVVTDARDIGPLKQILSRAGNPKNQIIVFTQDIFDYSAGEPPAGFLTPLRVLRISNEWIKRVLIDTASIERYYIAPDHAAGRALLHAQGWGVALTADLFTVTHWKNDGGWKTQVIEKLRPTDPRQAHFQSGDPQIRLRRLREELQVCQDGLSQAMARMQECEGHVKSIKGLVDQCKMSCRSVDSQIWRKEQSLRELEEEGRQDAPISLAVLQETKEEKEAAKADMKVQFTDLQQTKLGLQTELAMLQTQLDELKSKVDHVAQKCQNVMDKLDKQATKRATALDSQKHFQAKREVEETKLGKLRTTAAAVCETFKRWTSNAAEFGEKVEVRHSVAELQRQLGSLTHTIGTLERRNKKSPAELNAEVDKARAAYENHRKERKGLIHLSAVVSQSLEHRLDVWFYWLAYCSVSCKRNFAYNLSARGYFGQVIIDHNRRTLDLRVQTDDQAHGGSQGHKDPACLSGGEKSFSTLCLLLALWETCGSPIRCLDEFDVFMDGQFRRVSISMLISLAKISQGKQYVLITPNNIDYVQADSAVQISRMDDPRD